MTPLADRLAECVREMADVLNGNGNPEDDWHRLCRISLTLASISEDALLAERYAVARPPRPRKWWRFWR